MNEALYLYLLGCCYMFSHGMEMVLLLSICCCCYMSSWSAAVLGQEKCKVRWFFEFGQENLDPQQQGRARLLLCSIVALGCCRFFHDRGVVFFLLVWGLASGNAKPCYLAVCSVSYELYAVFLAGLGNEL